MALLKCWECGKEVSSEASSCPGCGAPPVKSEPIEKQHKPASLGKILAVFVIGVGFWVMVYSFISVSEPSVNQKQVATSTDQKPVGILIPRSMPGDQGRYYLLSQYEKERVIYAVHRRDGPSGPNWTRTETDCAWGRMRVIGVSEKGESFIKRIPSKWFDLVDGSSKSDLFNYLCKK